MTSQRAAVTRLALAIGLVAAAGLPLSAQSKGHPLIKPYEGSAHEGSTSTGFDEYDLLIGKLESGKPAPVKRLEGQVTTFYVRNPQGRSVLELYRNYDAAFKQAGFSTIFACRGPECGPQREVKGVGYVPYGDDSRYAAFARADAAAQVHVGMQVQPVYTYFTVIEAKVMDTGKAAVTAEALGAGILSEGHVAVYDVLFDTGKAEVKAESAPALEQIAAMLAKNPKLTLFVVGHTDNVGTLAANLDLSRRRAAAVVAALTTQYKVPAGRLKADGVGPLSPVASNDAESGRAKNRRVELVKQ